ncbi:hypothetical protein PV326_012667, partial [Microctonus aethiopoides]
YAIPDGDLNQQQQQQMQDDFRQMVGENIQVKAVWKNEGSIPLNNGNIDYNAAKNNLAKDCENPQSANTNLCNLLKSMNNN